VSAAFLLLFGCSANAFGDILDDVLAFHRPADVGFLTICLIIVLLSVIIICLTLGVTLTSSWKEFIRRVSGICAFTFIGVS